MKSIPLFRAAMPGFLPDIDTALSIILDTTGIQVKWEE
jgi:hypothetical protein